MCKHYLLLILAFFATFTCNAATFTNDIVFIENNIDNEYFITPQKTDPRFSGANVFTKYSKDQLSLPLLTR